MAKQVIRRRNRRPIEDVSGNGKPADMDVLRSLFEEQITADRNGWIRHMDPAERSFAEELAYFPDADDYPLGPDAYAEHISRLKSAVAIPVIASLNGTTPESWLKRRCSRRRSRSWRSGWWTC